MTKTRGALFAAALTPLLLFTGGAAKADDSPSSFLPTGEPLVWIDRCPFDARRPRAMRCFSKRLVPKSYADARRLGPFTAPPDGGYGVDASSDIGTCDGVTNTGSGGTASGLGPPDYVKAYAIPASPTGAGKIVAIVDACADPTVLSDLAAYRANYGLPALGECGGAAGHAPVAGGPACIGVVSQRGDGALPAPDDNWAGEIALDVEMVSAACPDCSILLVEADTPNAWDLGPAVNEAIALGANAVSNSYGAMEDPHDAFGAAYSDGPYAADFEHPGVLITAASGDDRYDNEVQGDTVPSFPSTVPSVLSVGGTSLSAATGTVHGGYAEVVWSDTTSGCSSEFAKPAFQNAIDTGGCATRAAVDVAAAGGRVATYQAGWGPLSGTSCASPFVAALLTRLGLANQPNAFFYAHASAFYDVTSGTNDFNHTCPSADAVMCHAGLGWDGPTGLGSPNGAALLALEADGGDAGQESDATTDATTTDATTIEDGSADATIGPDASGGADATVGDASEESGSGNGADDSGRVATGAAEGGTGGTESQTGGCGCTTVGGTSFERTSPEVAIVAVGALVVGGRRRRRR